MRKLAMSVVMVLSFSWSLGFMMYLSDPVFKSTGKEKRRTCIIMNTGENLLPVEIYAALRSYTKEGVEQVEEVEDDFLIVPNQLLLKPGEEKIINVVWNGDTDLSGEIAYRLIGEEFPLPEKDAHGQQSTYQMGNVKILRKIMRAMYVRGADTSPKIVLKSVKYIDKEGQDMLAINLSNDGNQHLIISKISLQLKQGGKSLTYSPVEIQGKINMLAGEERMLYAPWPAELNKGNLQAELSYED